MFRKNLVLRIGCYDPTYVTSQDADLWAHPRPHTRAANLDAPIVFYRKHGAATNATLGLPPPSPVPWPAMLCRRQA